MSLDTTTFYGRVFQVKLITKSYPSGASLEFYEDENLLWPMAWWTYEVCIRNRKNVSVRAQIGLQNRLLEFAELSDFLGA